MSGDTRRAGSGTGPQIRRAPVLSGGRILGGFQIGVGKRLQEFGWQQTCLARD